MGCQGSKSTSTAPASDKGESEEQKDNANANNTNNAHIVIPCSTEEGTGADDNDYNIMSSSLGMGEKVTEKRQRTESAVMVDEKCDLASISPVTELKNNNNAVHQLSMENYFETINFFPPASNDIFKEKSVKEGTKEEIMTVTDAPNDSSSDEDENTSKSKKEKASEEQGEPKQSEKQDQPEPITGADELASEPKVAEVEVASDGDNKPSEGPVSTETEQAVTQENSEPLVPSAPEEVSEISQGAKESEGKENQENQEGQENQESQERKQSAVDLSAAPVEDETQPDDKPATVAENGTPDDQSAEKPAEESAQ